VTTEQEFFPKGWERISAIREGRSPQDGYKRGWGIIFGGLQERIPQEADYQEAFALASGRSLLTLPKLMNLYLLIRWYLPKLEFGHIIEFGSYRGGSAVFLAKLAQRHLPGVKIYALDTYEGMPQTLEDIDAHSEGDFSNSSYSEIVDFAAANGLDNLIPVKGVFEETTEGVLKEAKTISLAHIDCDIYSGCLYSWNTIKPNMVPGGYVVFDDATVSSCIGATEVVEKAVIQRDGLLSEQIDPHFVFRYPPIIA